MYQLVSAISKMNVPSSEVAWILKINRRFYHFKGVQLILWISKGNNGDI